ncbi:MAG TPA: class I SAM-dependent methyltransferase [Candidatus Acidoferrales bacterium]|nr:class I SAM-dependent methyltransferase [Candidatus Acidoferrales bacterium]
MSALAELQRNWEGLAQADPLWAICTDPDKRHSNWSREEFFATGQDEIARVMDCVKAVGLQIDGSAPALDFGCGVGRVTRAMAAYFPECWGVDISPTMVRLATEFNQDTPRCRFAVNERRNLSSFQNDYFGFVYSNIVLQHIPKRLSRQYLAEMVRVARPGGILVFAVVEAFCVGLLAQWRQQLGVRRRLRRFARRNGNYAMDLHSCSEARIRHVLAAAGARIVDVRWTNSADPSFNGKLQYLRGEPGPGYVSKQYCVLKEEPNPESRERAGA